MLRIMNAMSTCHCFLNVDRSHVRDHALFEEHIKAVRDSIASGMIWNGHPSFDRRIARCSSKMPGLPPIRVTPGVRGSRSTASSAPSHSLLAQRKLVRGLSSLCQPQTSLPSSAATSLPHRHNFSVLDSTISLTEYPSPQTFILTSS
jgi:hypothetical protein